MLSYFLLSILPSFKQNYHKVNIQQLQILYVTVFYKAHISLTLHKYEFDYGTLNRLKTVGLTISSILGQLNNGKYPKTLALKLSVETHFLILIRNLSHSNSDS